MSLVTILWSMGASVALTLALLYGATWVLEKRLLPHLFFAILAIATAANARCELGMMHSVTPAEWGAWFRWYQAPLFAVILSETLFVGSYLATGRLWVLWTLVSMRAIHLVACTN